ncbi:MAG: glycoside hydrolase family 3 C-terminal domain-containing protein [Bacteroidales bacterium]|nr:glycoside hydrolase family 3 C-terminal domain-containing protein [Lachnoclostridium sp.]MCM1384744.1 glycoside hydrolase family 3 C-terminal domain-containing protein [Lachnoclostridium sp.]MCM1465242.1 glycoside hydrolase family 3 C-terminal domain-containing protein [Bacteroidales bacterium]
MADYEREIQEILRQMTLEEKVSMLHGRGFFRTAAVERLGIPELVMSDGPMGVRQQFPDDNWIAVGNSDDYVTYLPSNSALAATWNPVLAYEGGQILGEEARGRGKDVILAPGINIKRDPLCGRNFEYMSEDPYLIETLTVPFIKGVQESDVAACVKHFAVNNQETDRMAVDTIVDERTLREIYFPGFRAAVQEGGSYSLMNAYNRFRGIYCSENKELLDGVLRDEWKYDGTVISDWGSVHTTKEAAEASIDIEMSVTPNFDEYYFANPLIEAVKKREVKEEDVDKKVRNILRMMFRLKMLGPEVLDRKAGAYNTLEHRQGTRKIAEEAILLLKNEEQMLPITKERLNMTVEAAPRKKKIAVIGKNAEYNHAGGGGSAEIKALYEVSPLLGLKEALGGNVDIVYAPGYFIPGKKDVNEVNWQEASLERQVMGTSESEEEESEERRALRAEIEENRKRLKEEACSLAKEADEVIFVGGLNHDYDVEGRDRTDMKLPYGQDELIEALLQIAPNLIIVMVAGSPVEMPWLAKAKALVWCYYSGMETGRALADILLGKINPSAKLPETFPAVYADTPTARNGQFGLEEKVEYKEGIFVGYRYYEKENVKPAFPFGYGLSYTDFSLEHLEILQNENRKGDAEENDISVTFCVDVTNTGDMAGAEIVQCYVTDCECSVERPVKELKAYKKVFLKPGETQKVTMELPKRAFAFYDVGQKAFKVEPGKFRIQVGNASDHCTLQAEVEIGG